MTPLGSRDKTETSCVFNLICKAEKVNTLIIRDNSQIFLDYQGELNPRSEWT